MSSLSTQSYKGSRDYFPEEKRLQNYIFNVWRKTVESFGYEEYGAPLLEPMDIYLAKSGQELAGEQTYAFEDRGGRQVTIRPEMTPWQPDDTNLRCQHVCIRSQISCAMNARSVGESVSFGS